MLQAEAQPESRMLVSRIEIKITPRRRISFTLCHDSYDVAHAGCQKGFIIQKLSHEYLRVTRWNSPVETASVLYVCHGSRRCTMRIV